MRRLHPAGESPHTTNMLPRTGRSMRDPVTAASVVTGESRGGAHRLAKIVLLTGTLLALALIALTLLVTEEMRRRDLRAPTEELAASTRCWRSRRSGRSRARTCWLTTPASTCVRAGSPAAPRSTARPPVRNSRPCFGASWPARRSSGRDVSEPGPTMVMAAPGGFSTLGWPRARGHASLLDPAGEGAEGLIGLWAARKAADDLARTAMAVIRPGLRCHHPVSFTSPPPETPV